MQRLEGSASVAYSLPRNLHCRGEFAYVWQRGRFSNDMAFWRSRLSEEDSVKPVKKGEGLRFRLRTEEDLQAFREAVTAALADQEWSESGLEERAGKDGEVG